MKRQGRPLVLAGSALMVAGLTMIVTSGGFAFLAALLGVLLLPLGLLPWRGLGSTQRILRAVRWQLPLVISLVSGTVVSFAGHPPRPAFYSLSAQVLPLFLLAIALESRNVVPTIRSDWEFIYAAFLVAVLGVGEMGAFLAIGSGLPTRTDFAMTTAALAAGFVAVATLALINPERRESTDPPADEGGPASAR